MGEQWSDAEIERVARALEAALDEEIASCALIGESWSPREGTHADAGKLLMTVDGQIDLRGLARAAIAAVRSGGENK